MDDKYLGEIKKRAEAATSGPWKRRKDTNGLHHAEYGMTLLVVDNSEQHGKAVFYSSEDAEFCAHAREDIPALVKKVERLQEENKKFNTIFTDLLKFGKAEENKAKKILQEKLSNVDKS